MNRLTRLQKVQEKKRFYRCWNDVIMAFSNIRMQERYQAVSDCPSNAFVRPFLLHCNKYELYLSLVTLAVQSKLFLSFQRGCQAQAWIQPSET